MAEKRLWTRAEYIVTFNLYLKLPFGQMHARHKEIVQLSKLIGRTPSAVAMRLVNFASVDPFHQNRGVKGLEGGTKQCKPIFDEFIHDRETLMFESEKILANYQEIPIEEKFKGELIGISNYAGQTKERLIKTRVNQYLFRKIVLSAYSNKCAISGTNIPELLIASHIKRWADDENNRLNPSNGLCLNAFYDAAFDKGFIGIDENYKIILSEKVKKYSNEAYYSKYFKSIEHNQLQLPDRFLPDKSFLQFHLMTYFNQ
jgi:putative restriction endonuclease